MSDGTFADHPVSVTEARADRESDCRLWTPRDALINLLRDIDRGAVAPDALVCVYRSRLDNGNTQTRFVNAAPDIHTSLGLLVAGQFRLLED